MGRVSATNRLAGVVSAAIVVLVGLTAAPVSSAAIGPASFDGGVFLEGGLPATQAGSHPFSASTTFSLPTILDSSGREWASEDPRNVGVGLPPGLLGNPRLLPTCTAGQLEGNSLFALCPAESQVGTIRICLAGEYGSPGNPECSPTAVFNLKAPPGAAAVFGFNFGGATVHLFASLRTGTDYGALITARNAPQTLPFVGATVTLWGVPALAAHDAERICTGSLETGCPSTAPPKALISLPTACAGPQLTTIDLTGWGGGSGSAGFLSHDGAEPIPNPVGIDGCSALDFSPAIAVQPTTDVADAPSGLEVDLHIPQNEDPEVTVEAHLRDATVTLPEGLVVNPAATNGLDACSRGEFGLTSPVGSAPVQTTSDPATCPDASKLGTVEIDTPLLSDPLPGSIYMAAPYDNPFDSLFALYVAVDDPQTGTVVKLAGRVEPDPQTGRLSATFDESPQLPFEDFELKFFGGAGGALSTPSVCGTFVTTSSLVAWSAPDSGPPATPKAEYAIERAPVGAACPKSPGELPGTIALDSGTVSPVAGASSPFVLKISRPPGSQGFGSLSITAPPGLTASLDGVPYCPESALASISSAPGTASKEADRPSCPATSRVASITVGAGAGPQPLFVGGNVYLAGPYRGAPFSLAAVVPIRAGPFDLGTVVLRIGVDVDPLSAQLHLVTDPLPRIVDGIPLDLRRLDLFFDRPGFIRNPTSCDPMSITGTATSGPGVTTNLANRFQVGDCAGLGLKPRFALRLSGGTGRNGHPAVTALLRPRAGDANLSDASVSMPRGELIDPRRLTSVCTVGEFAAGDCPEGSIRGRARVWTPLLGEPLQGRVYLRESGHRYPDLAIDLNGQLHLTLVGRIQTPTRGIGVGFDFLPDVPISRLQLVLDGGRRGLLINSEGLCHRDRRAVLDVAGHNGVVREMRPRISATCGAR